MSPKYEKAIGANIPIRRGSPIGGGAITVAGAGGDASTLGGYTASEFARLAEDCTITGGWTFNANIALGTDVTIDGVDPSALAALQFLVLAASPHLTAERVLAPGAGLTGTDGGAGEAYTLAVGAGDGIVVAANSVAVDLAATSLLEFTGGDLRVAAAAAGEGLTGGGGSALAVGAGTLITVNANDVALAVGSAAFQVPLTGADPYTPAWTTALDDVSAPAEAILKSSAQGGLTLATLQVKGNVTVTDGGDLTVGANILFVDASLAAVGINCAPDSQFDLDILNHARVRGWLVAKMAQQLSDVTCLCHFDGELPWETDTTGDFGDVMGQAGVPTKAAIFRPGKFGTKALQLAPTTTNRVINPSFETGTTGWENVGCATFERTAVESVFGAYSLRIIADSANDQAREDVTGFDAASTVTVTAWVKSTSSSVRLRAYSMPSTTDLGSEYHSGSGEWERLTVTGTLAAGETIVRIQLRDDRASDWDAVYFDGIQAEQLAYSTPYCDGSLGGRDTAGNYDGTGHHWSGAAHASTSVRDGPSCVTYNSEGVINPAEGTLMFWMKVPVDTPDADLQDNVRIFEYGTWSAGKDHDWLVLLFGNSWEFIECTIYSNGNVYATQLSGNEWADGDWHFYCFTWKDGEKNQAYIDGETVAETGNVLADWTTPLEYSTFTIGDGSCNFQGYIDDLCILSKRITSERRLTIYESDAPVFAETSVRGFKAAKGGSPVWADHEGLWGRDASGNAILGLYGAEDTKSWGGHTLSPGDLLLGYGDNVFLWDISDTSLRIGNVGANKSNVYAKDGDVSLRINTVVHLLLDGSAETITVGASATEHILISSTAVQIKDGADVYLSLAAEAVIVGRTGEGFNNVYISSGEVSLRVAATKRISLTSAGVLTIKDSGGNAVITLDAALGAEITKKLTMPGASSAISIGATPPTASNDGTGIWIDRTGMYGLKKTGEDTVLHAKFDATTGAITAGAGVVTLDALGISVEVTGGYLATQSYRLMEGATPIGCMYGVAGAEINSIYIQNLEQAGHAGRVTIHADSPVTHSAGVVLQAVRGEDLIAVLLENGVENSFRPTPSETVDLGRTTNLWENAYINKLNVGAATGAIAGQIRHGANRRGQQTEAAGNLYIEDVAAKSTSGNSHFTKMFMVTFADDPLDGGVAQKVMGTYTIDVEAKTAIDGCMGIVSFVVVPSNNDAGQQTTGFFHFNSLSDTDYIDATLLGTLQKNNTGVDFTCNVKCNNGILTLAMTFTSYDAAFANGGTIRAWVDGYMLNALAG